MQWSVPRARAGQPIFVLAGGPSVAGQDLSALRGYCVIAINSAWLTYPDADYLFFADARWWSEFGQDVRRTFKGTIVSCASSHAQHALIRNLLRTGTPRGSLNWEAVWTGTKANTVCMKHTSVSGAIHLAGLLGGDPIILLGADGQLGPGGRRHHHDAPYPWDFKQNSFAKHNNEFLHLAPLYAKEGWRILNASPGTAFTAFQTVDLKEQLAMLPPPPSYSTSDEFYQRGGQALDRFVAALPQGARVLDVGAGLGAHANAMRATGLHVVTCDPHYPADCQQPYLDAVFPEPFDGLWASHVLEHQQDVGATLRKMRKDVRPGGLVAVSVPPLKHNIVGGHLTLWNAGLLLYNMIMAGFDCRQARVASYGYNISVLVNRVDAELPGLAHDNGDIERLAEFFPLPVKQGFDGRIGAVNW